MTILPLKENQSWELIRKVEDYDEKMIEDEKYMWYTQNMSRGEDIQLYQLKDQRSPDHSSSYSLCREGKRDDEWTVSILFFNENDRQGSTRQMKLTVIDE